MTTKKTTKKSPPKKLATIKLDIACGQNKREGFKGVDIAPGKGVDFVHDLETYPWPFKDNSVEEAHVSHYIEHVGDLVKFMNELYRILIPGGQCTVIAPYYSSIRAWQDPTHVRAISEATFLYFNQQWLKDNKLDHYNVTADFDFSYGYVFDQDWVGRSEEARAFAIKHYINVISDIQVVLTKRPHGKS